MVERQTRFYPQGLIIVEEPGTTTECGEHKEKAQAEGIRTSFPKTEGLRCGSGGSESGGRGSLA